MQKSIFFTVGITVLLIILLTDCAREYAPTGGPKDTVAPVVVKETPPNFSTQSDEKKFVVKFDEFFSLDNVTEKLMISPPLSKSPEFKIRKKKLIVDYSESEIKPNTTYSFVFNNIIKDLNESNYIDQYIYSFSTGDILDSLQVSGNVILAETNEVPEDIYILLHKNLNDSAPLKLIPDYVSKIDKKGNFSLLNIAEGDYRIYALKDQNKNLKFDLPNELFAFNDSIITPKVKIIETFDTLRVDTIYNEKDTMGFKVTDTIYRDTVIKKISCEYSPNNIKLQLFQENPSNQYIAFKSRSRKERFCFGFNIPLIDNHLKVSTSIGGLSEIQFEIEKNTKNDSVIVWLKDSSLISNDTLLLVLEYLESTPDGSRIKTDTIKTKYDLKKDAFKGKQKCILTPELSSKERKSLIGSYNFEVSSPLKDFDFSKIKLLTVHDTSAMINSLKEFYQVNEKTKEEIVGEILAPKPKNYYPKENYYEQSVIDKKFLPGRFALYFAKPFSVNEISLKLLRFPNLENWYIAEKDIETNSLTAILTNKEVQKLQNPALIITYPDEAIKKTDTIFFNDLNITKAKKSFLNRKPELFIDQKQLDAMFLNEKLEIICNNFIKEIDTSKFFIYDIEDTTKTRISLVIEKSEWSERRILLTCNWAKKKSYALTVEKGAVKDIFDEENKGIDFVIKTQSIKKEQYTKPIKYSIIQDTVQSRIFHIESSWISNMKYKVTVENGAFTNIYNNYNDTCNFLFSTKNIDQTGNLILTIKNVRNNSIVQLMNKDKKNVLDEQFIDKEGDVDFKHIDAGSYTIRIVNDINANKKWDTGNFKEKIQPESVYFYPGEINVKAKWDNKIEIKIGAGKSTKEVPKKDGE